jgi:hypothetical protein
MKIVTKKHKASIELNANGERSIRVLEPLEVAEEKTAEGDIGDLAKEIAAFNLRRVSICKAVNRDMPIGHEVYIQQQVLEG